MIRFPVGPSFRCSPRHPNSTKVDFSWKIPRRRISSNGMIRYYCPSPKIRKPQSAFPIRFFIGRKTFRSLECPPKFKARQDIERPNPKKAFFKHPSIGIRPFIARLPKSCPKGLKQAKKGEIGPNFSCSKISRGSACDTKLFYSLHRRSGHQSLSRTVRRNPIEVAIGEVPSSECVLQ